MTARYVGVRAATLVHAVLVPSDLERREMQVLRRDGAPPLIQTSTWSGQAACGQHVRHIIAGPAGGHDWDLVANRDKCPRCSRRLA